MKKKTSKAVKGERQIPAPEELHHGGAPNPDAATVADGKGGKKEVFKADASSMMEVRLTGALLGCCQEGICGSPNPDNGHAAGDIVKLPRAFVQKKPWLSEFGQSFDIEYAKEIAKLGTGMDPKRRLN